MLDLVQPEKPDPAADIGTLQRDLGVCTFLSIRIAKHLQASAHVHDAGAGAAIAHAKGDATMCWQCNDQRSQALRISVCDAHPRSSSGHGFTLQSGLFFGAGLAAVLGAVTAGVR